MQPDHPWTAAKFHGERDNLPPQVSEVRADQI
jgi:hypothetical protein